jgi:uncharacterized OB-fold protein
MTDANGVDLIAAGRREPDRLAASRCSTCGARACPPATVCATCLGTDLEQTAISGAGVLYAYTVVHVAPAGRDVPYAVGYVDLDDGPRVFVALDVARPWRVDQPVAVEPASDPGGGFVVAVDWGTDA